MEFSMQALVVVKIALTITPSVLTALSRHSSQGAFA
jgi:hypothetical protein